MLNFGRGRKRDERGKQTADLDTSTREIYIMHEIYYLSRNRWIVYKFYESFKFRESRYIKLKPRSR